MFCSWLFFLATFSCLSQAIDKKSYLTFQGIVLSEKDSFSVESAHIYIRDTSIGTITNSTGEFELKIPVELTQSEIIISSIGYKTEVLSINTLKADKTIVLLEPLYHLLEEVVVSSSRMDSSRYLLEQAINAIRFNYPRKNHLLEGFYRSASMLDTSYVRLIEAAIRVQEVGYQKKTWEEESLTMVKNRVKILEIRKSDDLRDKDFLTKALLLVFGERNDLYQVFGSNYIRILGRPSNHVMSSTNLEKYESEYISEVEWDGAKAHMISISNKQPKHFQWDEIIFIINKSDNAIVRIEVNRGANPNRKDIPPASLIEGKYFFKSDITYRKIDYKYYPVLIHTVSSDYDASNTVKIDGKVLKQSADQIFLLTNVISEDFSKIKWKEAEDRDKDLYKIDLPYNQQFWENYNTVKLNPLKRIPKELEKDIPLIEQFKKANKKND